MADKGSDEALLRSKKALERHRGARDAARAASEARDTIERRWYLDTHLAVFMGREKRQQSTGDEGASMESSMSPLEEVEGRLREYEDELREARAKEEQALDDLAEAAEDLQDATVEPRVEGMKLRFETRKLQATLSAGVLVGAATVTEVLLPPNPGYVYLLWAAYGAFIASLSGCISDMQRISIYVENLLTGGRTEVEDAGWREKVSRVMMYVNQRSLAFGLALFVLFATLNLA